MESGKHNVSWDGKNDKGVKVTSGVYFYYFDAGEFSEVRKMILVK
jgi:flagellar hook assembly protein FlgD